MLNARLAHAFAVLALLLVSTARGATLAKQLAARSLSAAGLPDPHCKTGVVSLKVEGKPQSCCPGYCGACHDHKTCKNVRGPASEKACCASALYENRCGSAPANVCWKTCSEAVPPCTLDIEASKLSPIKVTEVKGVPPCNEVVDVAELIDKAIPEYSKGLKVTAEAEKEVTAIKVQDRILHEVEVNIDVEPLVPDKALELPSGGFQRPQPCPPNQQRMDPSSDRTHQPQSEPTPEDAGIAAAFLAICFGFLSSSIFFVALSGAFFAASTVSGWGGANGEKPIVGNAPKSVPFDDLMIGRFIVSGIKKEDKQLMPAPHIT